ncbi:unnamed protein product, partial [Ectocarpus fasciculatus]
MSGWWFHTTQPGCNSSFTPSFYTRVDIPFTTTPRHPPLCYNLSRRRLVRSVELTPIHVALNFKCDTPNKNHLPASQRLKKRVRRESLPEIASGLWYIFHPRPHPPSLPTVDSPRE